MDITPKVIVIEGPLGVGKSTLLKSIMTNRAVDFSIVHVPEPVDKWTDWHGENVLKRAIHVGDNIFYFQTLVAQTYIEATKRAYAEAEHAIRTYGKPAFIVLERSPLTSGLNVFCKLAHSQLGTLNKGEFKLLKGIYGSLYDSSKPHVTPPDLVIGLWAPRDKFETVLWPRVVVRDGDMACREWTEKVYEAYEKYFADESKADYLHMVDCSAHKDVVCRDVVNIINSKFL